MGKNLSTILLLLGCLFLGSYLRVSFGHLKTTIDYDALEKAWKVGDDEHELRTEGDEYYRKLSDKSDDEAKALGPQMIFVTLTDENEAPLPDLASRWKEMLWNGGVDVNIYEISSLKLLVGLQKGIFVNDIMRFLDEQRNVEAYEWNGKMFLKQKPKRKQPVRKTAKKGDLKPSKADRGSQMTSKGEL